MQIVIDIPEEDYAVILANADIVNKRKTSEFRNIQDVVFKAQSDLEILSENKIRKDKKLGSY